MEKSEVQAIASHVWETGIHELKRLSETTDWDALGSIVKKLAHRSGRIHVTGAGTSGVAAKKIAHTLSCVEAPAYYLNPADAVHGSLGSVQPGDVVIMISKGGKTRELIQLLPGLAQKQVSIIAVTEAKESPIAQQADDILLYHVEHEADSFDMLATTSTMIVIALFDAVCMAFMQYTGFTKQQFALIHPGGAVGERLNSKEHA